MAGQRTIQGSRDPGVNFLDTAAVDAYFNVMGNGDMLLASRELYDFDDDDGAYEISKHVVDFAGTLDHWSVRIKDNARPVATTYRIEINKVATDLTVTVPALTDGDFPVEGEVSAAFVAGDEIVGHAISVSSTNTSPGLLQCYHEMTPDEGEATCFRTAGGGGMGGTTHPYPATFPLSGALDHYNSQYPQNHDLGGIAISQIPLQMPVRAAGRFSYLQVAPSGDSDDAQMYFDVNGANAGPTINITPSVPTVQILDTSGTADVVSGDLVSITGVDSTGTGNFIWSTGINWRGSENNHLVDLMITERAWLSYDRETAFNYNSEESTDNEYVAAPFGTFLPQLRSAVVAGDGLDSLGVVASFDLEFGHLRVNVETNINSSFDAARTLRVRPLFDGDEPSDFFIDVLEPGWYSNDTDSAVCAAGASFCWSVNGLGQSPSDDPHYSHITSITVSYGSETTIEPGPRVVPDPDPIEPEPCLTHRARCWKITRTDGEIFAFTEHDRDIVVALSADSPATLTTFKACGGLIGGASELGAVLGETGNQEISGYLSDLGFAGADVLGGKWTDADIEVWLIPWGSWIDVENIFQLASGKFGTQNTEDPAFTLEILSPSAQLARNSLLSIVTLACPNKLGDFRCGVDLDALTIEGSVTATPTYDDLELSPKRKFRDGARDEPDGWFDRGTITWLTGKNAGQSTDIKSYLRTAGHGDFVLWDPSIYAIEEDDTYRATPGCDKAAQTCKVKFNNHRRFRGFEFLPGTDAVTEFPDPKAN